MNQHTVIASAILAAAIVGAAWLMKPPCYVFHLEPMVFLLNRCTGEAWAISNGKMNRFMHPEGRAKASNTNTD